MGSRAVPLLLLVLAGWQTGALPLTPQQRSWYAKCVLDDPPVWKQWDNTMCQCREGLPVVTQGGLTVGPVCLPDSLQPPEGGIAGDNSARLAWPLQPENIGNGQPFRLHVKGYPGKTAIVVSWPEDTDLEAKPYSEARSHLTMLDINPKTGAYEIKKDIVLKGCVHSGGVVFNKRGDIAAFCGHYCPDCADPTKHLDPLIIEVKPDLSGEIRRGSARQPSCVTGSESKCYQKTGGSAHQWVDYDPVRDTYAVWTAGMTHGHVADMLIILDADPSKPMQITCGGWDWACSSGHTGGTAIRFHPEFEDFGALCVTDFFNRGMMYKKVSDSQILKVAPNTKSNKASFAAWPGQLVDCGCDFFAVWSGPTREDSYPAETVEVGFMRLDPATGKVKHKTWLTSLMLHNVRSVAMTRLGTGCNRFLVGYGVVPIDRVYATKFYLLEVDAEGVALTEPRDVSDAVMWHEDDHFETLANGDVVWVATWVRGNDGMPLQCGVNGDRTPTYRASGTYSGSGYGYSSFYTLTRGFKTNELFVARWRASERVGPLTAAGKAWKSFDRHPDCPPVASAPKQTACRKDVTDECLLKPCGDGQDCTDPNHGRLKDYECSCKGGAIKATGQPATCELDECAMLMPCGLGQTCNDPNKDPSSAGDFECTCEITKAKKVGGPVDSCRVDECVMNNAPCGDGQTCKDDGAGTKDFTCTCDNDPSVKATGEPAWCPRDECAFQNTTYEPCRVGARCWDPDPKVQGDYWCICLVNGERHRRQNMFARYCTIDECTFSPCGVGQTCTEANNQVYYDYTCTCDADTKLTSVGQPAQNCPRPSSDECLSSPCGVLGQQCFDPTATPGDFICTCNADKQKQSVGKPANCGDGPTPPPPSPTPPPPPPTPAPTTLTPPPAVDECATSPCGGDQLCKDPDMSTSNDFVCSCKSQPSITNINGPATCINDECTPNPCGT
eukprot:Sspe_Gene.75959::Locus_47459_Transcript_1_2_Confidence_0.667_Length_2910::g.75959::m.75959